MSALLAWAALGWSLVLAVVSGVALFRRWRTGSVQGVSRPFQGRVLLVRPAAGDDPWLYRALTSLEEARGAGALSLRVAVAHEGDGALPEARRAVAWLASRGHDARVVLTGAQGPNRKADQLARAIALEPEPFDAVLVVDADVALSGVDLGALLAPLSDARVGASWAPPVERAGSTVGDLASASVLGASLHAFTLLSALDPGGMVGKVLALRADALRDVGGFGALVRHLGEDMELARRLLARGWAVRASRVAVPSLAEGRTWASVVARYARWLSVIRAQRAALMLSYPGLFFATAPAGLLALSGLPGAPGVALLALSVALSSRLLVALAARRAAGAAPSLLGLVRECALADALLAAGFVGAMTSRGVDWRGVSLALDPSGALREDVRA